VIVVLYIVFVIVCLFLILVVLLQQGKGADLAGAFGGGGTQTSFGPRTRTNIMHRMTTASFVLFVVLSLCLAIRAGMIQRSVMDEVETEPASTAATEPKIDTEPTTEEAPPLLPESEALPPEAAGATEGTGEPETASPTAEESPGE
jgi:preprotein translocase subunit SecG